MFGILTDWTKLKTSVNGGFEGYKFPQVKFSKLYLQSCFKESLLIRNVLQIEVLLRQLSNRRILENNIVLHSDEYCKEKVISNNTV